MTVRRLFSKPETLLSPLRGVGIRACTFVLASSLIPLCGGQAFALSSDRVIEIPLVGIHQSPAAVTASVSKSVGIRVTARGDSEPLSVQLWHLSGRQSLIQEEYTAMLPRALAEGLTALGYDTRGLTITVLFGAPYRHSGASMTAALVIAAATALEGKTLKPEVVLTGTVEPDGQIGPIGNLDDKIEGAKASHYRTILYPASQSPGHQVDGVTAVPVSNMREALQYMLGS